VTDDRRNRILALLASPADPDPGARRLCDVSAEVTELSGAGIMLMTGDTPRGSVCATNEVSHLIEQLQYALGEGPCVDAYRQDRLILEPDLQNPAEVRWTAFAGPALDAGVRAVFGFPLRIGAVRLGALNLYRDRTGPLTDDQHADALVMADISAQTILAMQAGAPAGQLAVELDNGSDFQFVVHQASGMVAAQLDISVRLALVRLKAHAFGNDRSLVDVANDVVARRLRFGDGEAIS
jgi:GAF domain-containing protein